jgi:hypothetical protein
MTLESFANGNGPTGGNSGPGAGTSSLSMGPVVPMPDQLGADPHWWFC